MGQRATAGRWGCGDQDDAAAVRLGQHDREPTLRYLDERRRLWARRRALVQLRQLGYEVTLTAKEPAA